MRTGKVKFCQSCEYELWLWFLSKLCVHKMEDAGPKLLSHFWELPAGQALGDFPLADGRGKPIAAFL